MSANRERTFICVKPDGVHRNLCGKVIQRFEEKGFQLVAMKFLQASEELLKQHYINYANEPFFPSLAKYMTSGPVLAMVWEGLNVVKTGRLMLGESYPVESKPGTIRGDYSVVVKRSVVHGSDSVENAKSEIALWFKDNEVISWQPEIDIWIYEEQ